ncbi:putative signal peptide-containing protein with transmembrane domain [Cryptosporidium canis]|uniref:Signal peptide-containing protein with transmembrane domain n=1 Tax=Cryptosporidium canis TaxID=195482 RepID=A0A9D5DEA7_9CRYT|nr:putative signal peptide-containing protein with transmembrane domain [Cryptosporidium canis]
MRPNSYLLLIVFYFVCTALGGVDHVGAIQVHKNPENKTEGSSKEVDGSDEDQGQDGHASSDEESGDSTGGTAERSESDSGSKEENQGEAAEKGDDKNPKEESQGEAAEKSDDKSSEEGSSPSSSSEGEGKHAKEIVPSVQSKDTLKEEDEKNELKKLEEFKKSETLEKEPEQVGNKRAEVHVNNEEKYRVESEIISQGSVNSSDVRMTDENEFTIDHPAVNQVINKIIQPSTDEKQLQVEMKNDFEPESGTEESKQTKSVILTFDLSSEDLASKISLISDSKLTLTRYIGMNPQKAKITIVDPTVQLSSSQTRLSELSRYESMELDLSQKIPGKADIISLSEISSQIPIILQQHNTTVLRLLLEATTPQTQFGILSNMDGVGPTIVLELKPTVESNSTWMYTITGVAIIFVIIGVSIALYFQNKNKESQKIENIPLLNNKV